MARVADLKRAVGRGIRTVRGTRGQRRFAVDGKVSQQTICKWERGELPGVFVRFLHHLHVDEGVDLNRLIRGELGRENGGR